MTSTEDGEGPATSDFANSPVRPLVSGLFRETDGDAGAGAGAARGLAAHGFGGRLRAAFGQHGQLCVGIDPHDYLLDAWGLPRSAAGVRDFGLRVVDAAAGQVAAVKPQVAFYEVYGSAGYAALEDVLGAARSAGLLVIADAKRGDIGTSAEAYGRAWLSPGSPLEADAVTLTAYAGVGSLTAVFELAERAGKGAFVLSATSNPESFAAQTARVVGADQTLAGLVAAEVAAFNRAAADRAAVTRAASDPAAVTRPSSDPDALDPAALTRAASIRAPAGLAGERAPADLGNIGLVLGATKNLLDYGVDPALLATPTATPVLAPGFGFQGATFGQVRSVFGALTPSTVVAVSRSVLQNGPQKLSQSIRQQADELAGALAATA